MQDGVQQWLIQVLWLPYLSLTPEQRNKIWIIYFLKLSFKKKSMFILNYYWNIYLIDRNEMEHALHEFDIICTNGKLIIFEKKDMRNLITLTLL